MKSAHGADRAGASARSLLAFGSHRLNFATLHP
jgi:hypothetical protein